MTAQQGSLPGVPFATGKGPPETLAAGQHQLTGHSGEAANWKEAKMDWCKCGHRRVDHTDGKGPCQECKGTTIPCLGFCGDYPSTDTSGKQPTGS